MYYSNTGEEQDMNIRPLYVGILAAVAAAAFVCAMLIVRPAPGRAYDPAGAIADLRIIAAEPHSADEQEALAKVREYICFRLREMGIEPEIGTYRAENWFGSYDIHNIRAEISGEPGNPSILIMAHYDSVMEDLEMNISRSAGMADDGYGAATLLQLAEYFSRRKVPPVNGIQFLLTDSEETGPIEGSKAELEHNPGYYENVSFIINIEGRSFDGPVVLIQTAGENRNSIELFSAAGHPVASSLISGAFGLLPNLTDLISFQERGFRGFTFSTIGDIKYYHSDEDNLGNLHTDTLAHYGEQILPVVRQFAYDRTYSDPELFKTGERVFWFTLLPGVLIRYGSGTSLALFIAALLFCVIAAWFGKGMISSRLWMKQLSRWFLFAGVAAAAGVLAALALALLQGRGFNPLMLYGIPGDYLICGGFIAVMTIFAFRCRGTGRLYEQLAGGITLNMILFCIFSVLLPGGSYLFLLPACIGEAALFAVLHSRDGVVGWIGKILLLTVTAAAILLYVPMIWLLFYALTIGGLSILAFFTAAALAIAVPAAALFISA